MRIGHIEIPVSDPLASLRFYTDVLGFTLETNQGDRYIWLTMGETVVMLRPGFREPIANDLAAINLVLYTNDLPAVSARLRANGLPLEERSNCLHFTDPDGNWFQLVDPGEDHSGGDDATRGGEGA